MHRGATFPRPRVTPEPHGGAIFMALAWLVEPLARHRRALVGLNLAYFGAAVIAAAYAALNPGLQGATLQAAGEAFSPTGALGPLVRSYSEGQLAAAVGLTFLVNLLLGSGLTVTLPSAVVPFFGVVFGIYRGVLWGILFSPTPTAALGAGVLAALPTILLEGEAYVVAMLGVWLWWLPVMRTPGARWACWTAGLRLQARIYPAVAVLLALAAIVEACSVIFVLS
jgi:hypothetical protein